MKLVFYILYYFTLVCAWVLALPYLLWISFKPKYRNSIPARFACFKNPPFPSGKVWIHACSLGEVKALESLSKELKTPLHVSTITQTGFNAAKDYASQIRFLPFEIFLPFWVRPHRVLVVIEAELWLFMLLFAKLRGAHIVLVNARTSARSCENYLKLSWFYKLLFKNIDAVFAQSGVDEERLKLLGAKNIQINGNIKTALTPKITKHYTKPKKQVITLASTHEDEEELLLNAISPLDKKCVYIVVPRHPERFGKVEKMLKDYADKNNLRFGLIGEVEIEDFDILLCNRMGELVNIYAITDISFLGGSFVPNVGGHNPLEPAFFNNIIISGEHIFNQFALYEKVKNIYKVDLKEIPNLMSANLKKAQIEDSNALKPVLEYLKPLVEKI